MNDVTTKGQHSNRTEVSSRTVAVIDIGATAIRMAIAEIDGSGGVRTLETLSQAVSLGKDTFTTGSISHRSVEQCVGVLSSYRTKLAEYQIKDTDQVRVIATSAVREANNSLAFLDRVYSATGIAIDAVDEAEVNRITYMGILPFLQSDQELASARSMVVEVGGGSTELLVVKNCNVAFSQTYRLGSLRLRQMLETFRAPPRKRRHIMESEIQKIVERIRQRVASEEQLQLIALGGDIRFATAQVSPDWNPSLLERLPVATLEEFTTKILDLTVDEIVTRYHLSFPDAESLGPALLTYVHLARAFGLSNIVVTNVNLRDGLLQEMGVREAWTREFGNQIIRSALVLARKYNCDEKHARHVAKLSRMLFDQLRDYHQLESQYDTILHAAAILHEVGLFLNISSHHKHAYYLIKNSELFGLSKRDHLLVALVARYQRRATPQPSHDGYGTLPRDERIAVSKMAALLRLAIALDDSRSQRVKDLRCSIEGERLVVYVPNLDDLSLEQIALRQSGGLLEQTFGFEVVLRSM